MILLKKHKVDWELIHQRNQNKINKDNICGNIKRVDHDYKVGDKVMLNNQTAYKYETPYKGPFAIKQSWTNGVVTLQYGAKQLYIIYVKLNHINLIQTLNILPLKNIYDNVNI